MKQKDSLEEEVCIWQIAKELKEKHFEQCLCCDGSVEDAIDISCGEYIRAYRSQFAKTYEERRNE